jgi:hypothetical protein
MSKLVRAVVASIIVMCGVVVGWHLGPVLGGLVSGTYALRTDRGRPAVSGGDAGYGTLGGAEYITDTATLVASADAIITGTVLSTEFIGYSSGYADETGEIVMVEASSGSLAFPITEYEVSVDTVVLDDGTVGTASHITMRMVGIGDIEDGDPCSGGLTPLNVEGETYLFFLTEEPDGKAYGLYYGPHSRLTLELPEVTATTCPPSVVYWTEETDPAGFMAEVIAAIEE